VNNWYKIAMPVLLVISLLVSAVAITVLVTKENSAQQVAIAASGPNYQTYAEPNYVAIGCRGTGIGNGLAGSCHGATAQATSYTGGASCH
jgi:hypothetical protein